MRPGFHDVQEKSFIDKREACDGQNRATTLYQAGNRFLTDSLFAAAVAKYRAALQHWDHPGIHYNLALALVSLDRPLEAYESVVAALRYGPDGLQPDEYQRALDYRRMLRRQIAEVEVVCREPGAALGTGTVAAVLHWQSDANTRRLNELAPVYCGQAATYIHPCCTPCTIGLRGSATPPTPDTPPPQPCWPPGRCSHTSIDHRLLHDLVRISLHPGGPEGSPGVSVHIPF